MTLVNSVFESGITGGGGTPSSTMVLYVLAALALTVAVVFLIVVAYFHYVHRKYSHIPQPKRPRYDVIQKPGAISKSSS